MKLAFPNPTSSFLRVTSDMMTEGKKASRESARGRIIYPLHRDDKASVQRMLNFFQLDTYVTPHRHTACGASETICVLSGRLGYLVFDEKGEVIRIEDLGVSDVVDFEPNVWHGMVALEPDTVILEIKKGPYNMETDKEFAPWAAKEGSETCKLVLAQWEVLFKQSS